MSVPPGRSLGVLSTVAGRKPSEARAARPTQPAGGVQTRVVLTYDWSGTPEANMRRFGVPLFDEAQMATSLALLAGVVEQP